MKINNWQEFYDSLHIGSGYGQPVRKPNRAQLDAFELKTGVQLPKSYREFALVFGPGDFRSSFQIAVPGYQNLLNSAYDLEYANQAYGYRGAETARFPPPVRDVLERLYYFGLENEREWLGWDIADVREPATNEYAIYRVGLDSVHLVAESFKLLVEVICERLFRPDPSWDEQEHGSKQVFYPATYDPEVCDSSTLTHK